MSEFVFEYTIVFSGMFYTEETISNLNLSNIKTKNEIRKTECGQSVTSKINPNLSMAHYVMSITGDCESFQNEISALTTYIWG